MNRQRRIVIAVGAVCVTLAFWMAALVVGNYVDARARTDRIIIEQARENQRHIDCLAAFLIRRDPDGCQGVRDQLIRDGILPTNAGSNPTGPPG